MHIFNNNRGVQTIGIVIGIVVLVVAGGAYFLFNNSNTNEEVMAEEGEDMKEIEEVMIKDDTSRNSNTNQEAVMDKESEVVEKDGTNITTEPVTAVGGRYIDYSEATYASVAGQTRILYFYASWCPICKVADADITSNLDKIPDNVVILKLDYDTETVLKKKYGVTYQHTFVIVDASGNEIKKWNGGGIDLIVQNVN
ncbi:hypothetical protein IID19_05890 [Patescibacteria group bacterium]|nr:hypothetical protein [Patescibacteria group bacterium]